MREARDDVDEGGLAGTVGTEQSEELAFLDLERDAGERAQRAEALLDSDGLDCFQCARARGSRLSTP